MNSSLVCTKCGGRTRVVDVQSCSYFVSRRRECKECGERFSTKEVDVAFLVTYMRWQKVFNGIEDRLRISVEALTEILSILEEEADV